MTYFALVGSTQGRDSAPPKRILVVDDHPMVRERLADVLREEPDLMICGEADDHHPALRVAESTRPDLALVDLSLKQSHGLDLIKDLHIRFPSLPILAISMHDESLYAERAIRAGARGYITKQQATHKVLQAIRSVLQGNLYLSDKLTERLAAKLAGNPRGELALPIDSLTDRELRVFELLGQGRSTRQIAALLHLEIATIETYRARIKEKLNLSNANELLHSAIRWAGDQPLKRK